MLVLTGTGGQLGSSVLHHLLSQDLLPPSSLLISSSSPQNVPPIAQGYKIEVRHGDFKSPDSLTSAFNGASALFLMSLPGPSIERFEHHRNAIEAAKAAGVQTVIYTSTMFGGQSGLESVAGVHQAHIQTVRYLMESGLEYVILRLGVYMDNWWVYAGFQPRDGYDTSETDHTGIEWVLPNDGPVAWVIRDELAEATAKILADYQNYTGRTVALTGSTALTLGEVAKLVEQETGREVTIRVVGREEAAKFQKDRKWLPESANWVIDSWSTWHDGLADGETAMIDPLLEKLIGRKPRTMAEMAGLLFVKPNQ